MEELKMTSYNTLDIEPRPYWLASTETRNYPPLSRDIEVDVVVVGGGMVGIITSYFLKQKGLTVAIIESDNILHGTTGHTTAKVTSQHGLIYNKTQNKLGDEIAQQYAQANQYAIKKIRQLIEENNIDCDYQQRPGYVYTQDDKYVQQVMDEAKTAESLGIEAEFVEEVPLPFATKGAVMFHEQGQFHPLKFLLPLADEIPGNGSYIFQQTRAVEVVEGNPKAVITEHGNEVKAERVIVASHYPFHDKPGLYFSRVYPERSYVLAVKAKEKLAMVCLSLQRSLVAHYALKNIRIGS